LGDYWHIIEVVKGGGLTGMFLQLTLTPGAERFIRERQAQDSLTTVAAVTRQVFRDARRLSADLHVEPGLTDGGWVLLRVEVSWHDAERARRARDDWYAHTAQVCRPEELAYFGLEMDRKPGSSGRSSDPPF
jgi:hypothetical protein